MSGAGIHMPNPSYWPLVTAVGVRRLFVGIMLLPKTGPWGIVVAVSVLFFGDLQLAVRAGLLRVHERPRHGGH